jgi:pimeloyl-ACP methyl ester carboxylesterase
MPLCGARSPQDRDAAFVELVRRDPVLAYIDPVVRQAADEFPAALAELRERLPLDDGPIGVVGGSLGGAVALRVLARRETPIAAAALINAAIRARSVVGLVEGVAGAPYEWHEEAQRTADRLDFVARADEVAGPPVLVVSGELDFPSLRTDAAELTDALRGRYTEHNHVRLVEIPGLAHPLAEPPGIEPAPQLPVAKAVDDVVTEWFRRYLR